MAQDRIVPQLDLLTPSHTFYRVWPQDRIVPQLDPKVPLETLVSEMAIYEGGYPKYVADAPHSALQYPHTTHAVHLPSVHG